MKCLPRVPVELLIYSVVFLIGFADYLIGHSFGFSNFYLLPIIVTVRNLGKNRGLFISVLCAALWAGMDYFYGGAYSSNFAMVWSTLIRLTLFTVIVLIFDGLEKEKEWVRMDPLTMIANHAAFYEFGEMEVRRCRRYEHGFSLVYLDVDHFRLINDRFGHRAGDQLLVLLAETLKSSFRETDLVARLGEDEFAIVLVETQALGAAQALRRVMESLEKVPKIGSLATLSVGLITFTRAPETFERAVKRADELMHLAKNKGRNCIQQAVDDDAS